MYFDTDKRNSTLQLLHNLIGIPFTDLFIDTSSGWSLSVQLARSFKKLTKYIGLYKPSKIVRPRWVFSGPNTSLLLINKVFSASHRHYYIHCTVIPVGRKWIIMIWWNFVHYDLCSYSNSAMGIFLALDAFISTYIATSCESLPKTWLSECDHHVHGIHCGLWQQSSHACKYMTS